MSLAAAIPRTLANRLLHLAQSSPNQEVCGLLAAKDGLAQSCYPIANVADSPQRRFLLDPQGQIDAMRSMREKGETLFAIFHSHPDAPAQPSAEDAAQAAYPEALYLIISLNTQGVLELRGFRFASGASAFSEVELLLAES